MAILCFISARWSRLVKSMKVLLGFSVVCLAAVCFGDGVGESEIMIGLVGVSGVFGGVDSREEGICGISRMVRGIWMASGSMIPGIGIVSESEVGSSDWLDVRW